jgi:hypothetical protein
MSADSGLTISVYTAEPGSRSQEALDLLGSWAATPHEQPTREADGARPIGSSSTSAAE